MEVTKWPEKGLQEHVQQLEKEHSHLQAQLFEAGEHIRNLSARLAAEVAERKQVGNVCLQLAEELMKLKKECEERCNVEE